MTDPEVVRQIHLDYIAAGADIITTNTYGVIRNDLAKIGIEDRFAELNSLACKLALEAREMSGRNVLIAGSLPPLRGSYRSDLVGPIEEIEALYQEQAEILSPFVDLLLCETMSSATEGLAAAKAACSTGKPVWVSWTLHEDRSSNLRSEESVEDAVIALENLSVSGFLANCCAPESITRFIPKITGTGIKWFGGYANTFAPIPQDWTLDGDKESDGLLTLRSDLDPESYGTHVTDWLDAGATVIGGCCGTRPAHTARMRTLIDKY
jgi:S-methylmethionine-dependent homocysteine/selenocysteine methylase